MPKQPTTITLELANPDGVTAYRGRDVEVVGDRTIEARGDGFYEAWDKLRYRYHV
ncbi:MAG: hypothetical protein O3A46_14040 [Candidatus Poribacteria bacterium]|nr:hypothetical protein [Candidatus Poribacteria bacterium]